LLLRIGLRATLTAARALTDSNQDTYKNEAPSVLDGASLSSAQNNCSEQRFKRKLALADGSTG
jgi:hypothetical protein